MGKYKFYKRQGERFIWRKNYSDNFFNVKKKSKLRHKLKCCLTLIELMNWSVGAAISY